MEIRTILLSHITHGRQERFQYCGKNSFGIVNIIPYVVKLIILFQFVEN